MSRKIIFILARTENTFSVQIVCFLKFFFLFLLKFYCKFLCMMFSFPTNKCCLFKTWVFISSEVSLWRRYKLALAYCLWTIDFSRIFWYVLAYIFSFQVFYHILISIFWFLTKFHICVNYPLCCRCLLFKILSVKPPSPAFFWTVVRSSPSLPNFAHPSLSTRAALLPGPSCSKSG